MTGSLESTTSRLRLCHGCFGATAGILSRWAPGHALCGWPISLPARGTLTKLAVQPGPILAAGRHMA